MTLVLSVLTPRHAIQVSDRRLVWFKGGSIRRHDDERNKAVLWCGRLMFAYTGLAELGQERRTDQWLAKQLSEIEGSVRDLPQVISATGQTTEVYDQAHLLNSLAERATAYFQGPRISRIDAELRRHAFVAVGWARFSGEGDFSPYFAHISNFHTEELTELPHALPKFNFSWRRLEPSEGGYVLATGVRLERSEIDALRAILAGVDREPMAIVEVLGEKIREVAAKSEVVGRGLMGNVLPRAAVRPGQTEHFTLLGPPVPDQPTFLYVPPDDNPPATFYGPTYVCGGSIMSDFKVTPL